MSCTKCPVKSRLSGNDTFSVLPRFLFVFIAAAMIVLAISPARGQETPVMCTAECPDGKTWVQVHCTNITPQEWAACPGSGGSTDSSSSTLNTSNTGSSSSLAPLTGAALRREMNQQLRVGVANAAMQGAINGFLSSMAKNNAAAQQQQQAFQQEMLRRQQETAEQQRLAEQQRINAMFTRLNNELKLEGVPFNLSLKGMNSTGPDGLQLKGINSSGPGDLKLKIGDTSTNSYGIKGLPGIYVGGPAGGDTASSNSPAAGTANAAGSGNASGASAGNPNLVSGPGTGTTGQGIAGLPGIYLDGVQPSQAPQLAQAAQNMSGPERDVAQDTALHAAENNPALTAPSQDPQVTNFQQSNQQYRQALQSDTSASQTYNDAQARAAADQSAIQTAQNQLASLQPTVDQQAALKNMLDVAKTDEDASVAARKMFDDANAHLSIARGNAAGALASLAPPSNLSSGAPVVGLNRNAVVTNLKTPIRGGVPVSLPIANSATASMPPTGRQYRPSGNGLVGGTGWIVGYNVPNPTPELIAKSRAMLAEQEKLAGHPYSDAIDFQRYNFVIGIAAYADFGSDLLARVITHDEFTEGRYSVENMPGYAALTGRSFNELACHSNGAMVCLAALERKDVKADNVVLYGPQITEKSLEEWDGLVRSGQVKSVTLVFNSGDPVPPLSLGFEDYFRSRAPLQPETYANKALLKTQDLTSAINETAPRLLVHVYDCTFTLSDPMHCHGMDTYRGEGAH